MCYQTYTLLHIKGDILVYGFLFFSTLCSYNFYWLLSKYSFRKKAGLPVFVKDNLSYGVLFLFSAAGTLITLSELPSIVPHAAVAVVLTLLYSLPLWPFPVTQRLRKAGFLKTTLLAFTWAYVTTIIPGVSIPPSGWQTLVTLFAARFFFMALLCIIFDTRDITVDKMNALRSLATDVSSRSLALIMWIVFSCYIAAGIAVRVHFRDNAQLVAFLVTGVMVWTVYQVSRKPRGYLFYYFIVDGLMLFSAFATFVASLF